MGDGWGVTFTTVAFFVVCMRTENRCDKPKEQYTLDFLAKMLHCLFLQAMANAYNILQLHRCVGVYFLIIK